MSENCELKIIARIYNKYTGKFGIPRQSGIGKGVMSEIVFEKEYRFEEALRGIEDYSHLWLLWQFSESLRDDWRPTVRPPRLGGNKRVGVFATRSPFRPNSIGLSSVKLEEVKKLPGKGCVLIVSGADLQNGTPIFDIKPYLAYTDSHPDAIGGFADDVRDYRLEVVIPPEFLTLIKCEDRNDIYSILENDPRPSYHLHPEREYGFEFGEYEIKFVVKDGVLTVTNIALNDDR